jgi:hypothetical protein
MQSIQSTALFSPEPRLQHSLRRGRVLSAGLWVDKCVTVACPYACHLVIEISKFRVNGHDDVTGERSHSGDALASSRDRHVHVVLPGECPGVKGAVTVSVPTISVSPSWITRTFVTRGKPSLVKVNCGSSGVGRPSVSARALDGLAATVAWLALCNAWMPPA